MQTYIALFRGINVGGKNILPMKELRNVLAGLGLQKVTTYIQSGNVIFQSDVTDREKLSGDITAAIGKSHGFEPYVLILLIDELRKIIAANPFPEGDDDPKKLHLFFMESKPLNPDLTAIEAVKKDSEKYRIIGNVFYMHAGEGFARSKLAMRVEKLLGVTTTARNWRTVNKLMSMAEDITGV